MKYRHLFCVLVLAVVSSFALNAQVAGRLAGSVIDQTGAGVPGATVSLFLAGGTSPVIETQTTPEGFFTIASVRPDYYNLVVDATGFAKATIGNVKVDAAKETALPSIRLELASASVTLEVTDSSTAVQTAGAEIATTVTPGQVENLPVLDRQVTNLFITQAGVANSRTSTTINGLRPSFANVLLDGINIQDSVRTNALDYIPNKLTIGQIAEMTLSTSNANPTIGGSAATVALSTPSGTNQYHGNAYWYNRNSAFAANDWFNNKDGVDRPFLNLNQIGGSIGGPILKDKLLFYANYESYRLRQSTPVTNKILSPEARQGIFRYRDKSGAVQQFNVLSQFGLQVDPYIQKLISMTPAQSNSGSVGDGLNLLGYSFNARDNETRDNVTGKVDYYLSTRHTISGSYIWNRDIVDRPDTISSQNYFFTAVPPIFNDNKAKFFSASWRWNPAATVTNELRGGFNLEPSNFQRTGDTPSLLLTNLWFTNPVSQKLPEGRDVKNYAIQDNANWVKAAHTFSFGFQTTVFLSSSYLYDGTVPNYTLGVPTTGTGYGFKAGDIPGAGTADVTAANRLLTTLAGIVTSGTQTFNAGSRSEGFVPGAPSRYDWRMNNYAPYLGDTWKLRRNLTLVLGVRWEYFSPVNEANGMIISPSVASGNPIEALLGNATLDFAGNAVGRPLYHRDLNNFAPNVGFAWDIFGDGSTAVRGGYSLSYVNDNNINSVYNVLSRNNGLATARGIGNLNAFISGNLPAIPVPTFRVPTTSQAEFDASPLSPPVEGIVDPNLRTPYVQQWNLGVERTVKGFLVSARYVGNHVTKQLRVIDENQINVKQGTLLEDFIAGRNNAFLSYNSGGAFTPAYNAAVEGSVPLPFFDQLKQTNPKFSISSAGYLGYFLRGEVGTLANVLQNNRYFPYPGFSYWPNALLGGYAMYMTNYSNSTYNSAQFEVTKRTRGGIQIQASYVFSKALSDALQFRGLDELLDNNSPSIEKARAPYDLTHAIKLNHYVPLPFGSGRRFNTANSLLGRVASGWGLSGFMTVQSGPPVSILSQRGTLNRGARSVQNTVDSPLTLGELQSAGGLYMTGDGPMFIDPKHVSADGYGVAGDGEDPFTGQIFYNPQPGTNGSLQRRLLSGPWFKNYDFAILKDTRITERQSVQFRADFFNVFNHPNFFVDDQYVNSPDFGRITSTMSTGNGVSSRVIQFGLFYRF